MTPEDFEAAMDSMFARSKILERTRLLARDRDFARDPQDVCDYELADTLADQRAWWQRKKARQA